MPDPRLELLRQLFTLQRMSNALVDDSDRVIRAAFNEFIGDLAKLDPTAVQLRYRRDRIDRLLERAGEIIGPAFDQWLREQREEMARVGTQVVGNETMRLRAVIGAGAEGAVSSATGLGVNYFKRVLDAQPFEGAILKDWAAEQSRRTVFRVGQQLKLGVANSETIGDIIRRVRGRSAGRAGQFTGGVLETTTREAEALVRTGVAHIADHARQGTYEANADILTGYQLVVTMDGRTSPICINYGLTPEKVYPIGSGPQPPFHFNCLPGGSLVLSRGRVSGVSKRWFDGDVVILRTASGRELTTTPNHPVLTDKGWVAAGLLNEGDHVICDGGSEWGDDVVGDNENTPTPIQDVAEAFFGASEVISGPVPVTAKDFHGDGIDGDVAVVGADRRLVSDIHAALAEHAGEPTFLARDMGLVLFPNLSTATQLPEASSLASGGFVRWAGESFALGGGHSSHSGVLLLTPVARGNTIFAQDAVNHTGRAPESFTYPASPNPFTEQADHLVGGQVNDPSILGVDPRLSHDAVDYLVRDPEVARDSLAGPPRAIGGEHGVGVDLRSGATDDDPGAFKPIGDGLDADVELARQICSGAAGKVFADEVVHVKREWFSDHVFNLETVSGYYTASGVIVHNCRTSTAPAPDWKALGVEPPDEGTRATATGQVPADWDFDKWLRQAPKSYAVDLLGPTRARLFHEERMNLRELLKSDRGRVRLAPVADLAA